MIKQKWDIKFDEHFEHLKVGSADFTYQDYINIKKFIQQEIKDALESVIPISKEKWIGNEDYKNGWEQCREQINQNIKHYIE